MKAKIKMSATRKTSKQLHDPSEFRLENRSFTDAWLLKTLSTNEQLSQFVDEDINSAVTSNGISLIFDRGTKTSKNYEFCEYGLRWKYSINEEVENAE